MTEKVVVKQKENGDLEAKTIIGTARIIRDSLSNATYIGFTGTPISSKDRSTREVFGDYIDIYDIVIINTFFTPNIFTLIIVIGLFTWQGVARITRAETLSLKKRDFVLASRALGVSHWWIIVHHIIPNLMNHVIVVASVSVSNSIMLESSLSFLGYGVSVPIPSWGGMLQNAQSFILDRPLLAFFPGLLILLTILCISGRICRKWDFHPSA